MQLGTTVVSSCCRGNSGRETIVSVTHLTSMFMDCDDATAVHRLCSLELSATPTPIRADGRITDRLLWTPWRVMSRAGTPGEPRDSRKRFVKDYAERTCPPLRPQGQEEPLFRALA